MSFPFLCPAPRYAQGPHRDDYEERDVTTPTDAKTLRIFMHFGVRRRAPQAVRLPIGVIFR